MADKVLKAINFPGLEDTYFVAGTEPTKAVGKNSFAYGSSVLASGTNSHAEGIETQAIGTEAHAEGGETQAKGNKSHAEGLKTTAFGATSHSEGWSTVAADVNKSVTDLVNDWEANKNFSAAIGISAHIEGKDCIASGSESHAEGYQTRASGARSHTEGTGTVALKHSQHVQGRYNIKDTGTAPNNASLGKYAHIVGNGTDDTNRSNAHTLDWSGNAWYAGSIRVGGSGYDDAFELSPVIESTDYPNCYYFHVDGGQSGIKWLNPPLQVASPMEVGQAYRTAKSYNGKDVYTIVIPCSALPNNTNMFISYASYPDIYDSKAGKSIIDKIVSYTATTGTFAIPAKWQENTTNGMMTREINVIVATWGINVNTNYDASGLSGYFTIEYTLI